MANLTYHLKQVSNKANANETAIANISKQTASSTSNVMMGGNLALANYAVTKNFATVTYTGNGSSQSINTGISSVDFTVSGNGSGYWLDRTTNQVKNDAGTVQASGSCVCNVSKVHIKSRNTAYSHFVTDGIRGKQEVVFTDSTDAETNFTDAITSFDATGFSLNTRAGVNASGATYVAYQTLYTHIKWGTTNQGKFYVEAYNPVTREGMIYYIGSGIAGHEIPHSTETDIDYAVFKNLDAGSNWVATSSQFNGQGINQNETGTPWTDTSIFTDDTLSGKSFTVGSNATYINGNGSEYITYYKAKSETWTIVPYQGSGASGNFVETVDVNGVARKPRRVIIKRTDSTGNWQVMDTEQGAGDLDYTLALNLADAGASINWFDVQSNGFTTTGAVLNTSGAQYIALVEFDTNGDGGDSYFDLPTDDSNLNVTAGTFTYTNGIGSNGYERSAESYTGAIDFAGMSDGLKWIAKTEGGSFTAYNKKPTIVSDAPTGAISEYQFATQTGKWYDLTGTALTTPVSFLPNPVMVASETPMDIRYDDELAYEVAESVAVKDHIELDGVKVKGFLGQGQTIVDVTAQRALGVTYTNNTGKPIYVYPNFQLGSGQVSIRMSLAVTYKGATYRNYDSAYRSTYPHITFSAIIPDGASYIYQDQGSTATPTILKWHELR